MVDDQNRTESIKNGINIDIDKYYNDYIKSLDRWRSCNAPLTEITVDNVNSIDSGTVNPIESRCHAFYRFIGFPVLAPDNSFFNPGVGMTAAKTSNAVTISRSLLEKNNLEKIIGERTIYQGQINDIFQKNSIGASVLTLSLKNVSKLNYFFEKSLNQDPYALDENSQTNTEKKDIIYKDETYGISMLNYYFTNSNFTAEKELIDNPSPFEFKHLIRPFLVDPRISFSAGEKSFKIPFCDNKDFKGSSPLTFLESTCEDRYLYKTQELTSDERKLLAQVSSANQNINTSQNYNNQIYYNFVVKMQYVIKQLIENIRRVKNTLCIYYFLPTPSRLGVDNGVELSKIRYESVYNLDVEKEIILLNAQIAIRKIDLSTDKILSPLNLTTSAITDKPNPGPPRDSPHTSVGLVTDSNTKIFEDQLKALRSGRTGECLQACQALKRIEYITGTFSGLGIIDYLVIMNALYLIDEKDLFGLLDEDAFENFKKRTENNDIERNSSIISSLSKFNETVKVLYDTVQSIYETSLK